MVIKRSAVKRYHLFSGDKPHCLLGHVFHHFHVSPYHASVGNNYPEPLKFLLKDDTSIHGEIYHEVTTENDKGNLNSAVRILNDHGLNIVLT